MIKRYSIIVAGGKGTRILSSLPKQFIPLNGIPILMHTLTAFYRAAQGIDLIVVLPSAAIKTWKSLCNKHKFKIPHAVVQGGVTRFHSVKNGLALVIEKSVVAVHDGVRPLIKKEIILKTFEEAEKKGNAITAVPVKESIRMKSNKGCIAVDRNQYYLVQTPQCFKSEIIIKAYRQAYHEKFTDDASVVESAGEKINLTEGDNQNIKITLQEDILYAESVLKSDKR